MEVLNVQSDIYLTRSLPSKEFLTPTYRKGEDSLGRKANFIEDGNSVNHDFCKLWRNSFIHLKSPCDLNKYDDSDFSSLSLPYAELQKEIGEHLNLFDFIERKPHTRERLNLNINHECNVLPFRLEKNLYNEDACNLVAKTNSIGIDRVKNTIDHLNKDVNSWQHNI